MSKENNRCFQIISEPDGTFTLFDRFFGVIRTWKVADDAHPGIAILQDRVDKESTEIRKMLPDNYPDLDKKSRRKAIQDSMSKMSDEKKIEYLNRLSRNSDKQIAVQASYVEPLDEIPDIWDNKIEFFASCLSDDSDSLKITDFFFKRLKDSTTSPEESGQTEKGKK